MGQFRGHLIYSEHSGLLTVTCVSVNETISILGIFSM